MFQKSHDLGLGFRLGLGLLNCFVVFNVQSQKATSSVSFNLIYINAKEPARSLNTYWSLTFLLCHTSFIWSFHHTNFAKCFSETLLPTPSFSLPRQLPIALLIVHSRLGQHSIFGKFPDGLH